MSPLSYEKHRECFLWLGRQQKRRRRLRLNDYFSILFESRYTVWLQSQEEARWHLQQNPQQVEQILAANNPLLAPVGKLRACLFIDNATSTSGIANLEGISISTFNLQLDLFGNLYEARTVDGEKGVLEAVSFLRFKPVGSIQDEQCWLEWKAPTRGRCPLPSPIAQTIIDDLALHIDSELCA